MGGFSKVTNFLRDALMTPDAQMTRPQSEVAQLLQDDIPGMEISQMDDTGFEMVTKVSECAFFCSTRLRVTFFPIG